MQPRSFSTMSSILPTETPLAIRTAPPTTRLSRRTSCAEPEPCVVCPAAGLSPPSTSVQTTPLLTTQGNMDFICMEQSPSKFGYVEREHSGRKVKGELLRRLGGRFRGLL